ncbi:hypothetical protein K0M31_003802 [Melipona bicolor]|uniref:Uncharacterized protein n=1 Tax=Melipona bicolor TaxID=60889 RepID=A0AA40KNT9_9HYME|nr:hypothetical protein K0M31_003802 [Melipona bicolor]
MASVGQGHNSRKPRLDTRRKGALRYLGNPERRFSWWLALAEQIKQRTRSEIPLNRSFAESTRSSEPAGEPVRKSGYNLDEPPPGAGYIPS